MDPFIFLVFAVLVFASVQFGAYFLLRSKRPKPPIRGTGEVDASEYNAAPIPKLNRKQKNEK